MLQRISLALLLLVILGVSAIFAARHLGIPLPWHIATLDREAPSNDREETPSQKDASKTAEKTPDAATPEATIDETTKALGGAPGAAPTGGNVAIDISRISPDGTSVFAGRAEPNTYVTVLEDGKPAGTVQADENGEWSLSTEHKFASADPKLSYESSTTPPAPPKTEIAKAEAARPSASAVAGEVMRKFENLVEEAREEAKKNEAAKNDEAAKKDEETKRNEEAKEAAPPAEAAKENAPPETLAVTEPSAPPAKDETVTGAAEDGEAATGASSSRANEKTTSTATVVPPSDAASAGVKTDVIPVPIMFVYNEATLTPEGERAAALLLEYLTLKHLSAVELSGHADERGSDDYNYDLSRERLETVSRLLKDGGYGGDLKLTPKGKTEPYMGVDRTAYSGEALFQLDRRVELRVTR